MYLCKYKFIQKREKKIRGIVHVMHCIYYTVMMFSFCIFKQSALKFVFHFSFSPFSCIYFYLLPYSCLSVTFNCLHFTPPPQFFMNLEPDELMRFQHRKKNSNVFFFALVLQFFSCCSTVFMLIHEMKM